MMLKMSFWKQLPGAVISHELEKNRRDQTIPATESWASFQHMGPDARVENADVASFIDTGFISFTDRAQRVDAADTLGK